MSLIDNPKAWILRLFEMEENEGRGENCKRYPSGINHPGIPLFKDELIYGIYKDKYFFTPISFIQKTKDGFDKIRWEEINNCTSAHGEGKKNSVLTLIDGRTVNVKVGDFAIGSSGRISQLFHQMIQKWGTRGTLGPKPMSIEQFFNAVDDDYCFAPNLEPHPSLSEIKEALLNLQKTEGINDVYINILEIEDDIPVSNAVIIRANLLFPEKELEEFSKRFGADGVINADENTIKAFPKDENIKTKMIVWD